MRLLCGYESTIRQHKARQATDDGQLKPGPVSIQTQALALASSQSWLPLLRPSIPIGWRLRLLPTQALAFLAVFVYATHVTHAAH